MCPYEPDKMTVVVNMTTSYLSLPPLRKGQPQITLTPDDGKDTHFVDIEEHARPSEIKLAGLDALERRGKIAFHPKGSTPKGIPKRQPVAGVQPPTKSDAALNALIEKEEREEGRTRQVNRRRAT